MISAHLNSIAEKGAKTVAKRFTDASVARNDAEAALRLRGVEDEAKVYIASQQKDYNKLAQDLLSNLIADFHYLEAAEQGETCNGYVALMREIRYIPSQLAECLKKGIDFAYFADNLCAQYPQFKDKISIKSRDDYAMPVGLLTSPFIEFFMQRFTQLFARIGVADYSPERLLSVRSLVPFGQGASR